MLKNKLHKLIAGGGVVKKFVIWIAVIVVLVGALTAVIVQINLTKTLSEEFRERGQVVSRNLASSSVEPLLIDDAVNLHRLVGNVKNVEKDIKYVYIIDVRGRVLAHTFEGGFPSDLLSIRNDANGRLLYTGDGYVIDITAPILDGRAGFVHVGMDETYLNEKIAKTRDFIITLTLIIGAMGVLMAYIVVIKDITDQKEMAKLEKQLLQSEKLATVGKLAAGVAHEINNPLTSISLHTQIMLRKNIDESINDRLEIINREAHRAARIVKGLLEFARQSEPKLNTVNINNEIEKVLKILDPQLNGIRVTTVLEPLPPVMADSEQIQQVIINMLTNSIQSITTNGEIIIRTAAKKDNIEISLTDNGCGIPQENIGKIFDPFFSTKKLGEGTGLGLSTCYGIIKQHNGSIDVKSEVGTGTTFIIRLPI